MREDYYVVNSSMVIGMARLGVEGDCEGGGEGPSAGCVVAGFLSSATMHYIVA